MTRFQRLTAFLPCVERRNIKRFSKKKQILLYKEFSTKKKELFRKLPALVVLKRVTFC